MRPSVNSATQSVPSSRHTSHADLPHPRTTRTISRVHLQVEGVDRPPRRSAPDLGRRHGRRRVVDRELLGARGDVAARVGGAQRERVHAVAEPVRVDRRADGRRPRARGHRVGVARVLDRVEREPGGLGARAPDARPVARLVDDRPGAGHPAGGAPERSADDANVRRGVIAHIDHDVLQRRGRSHPIAQAGPGAADDEQAQGLRGTRRDVHAQRRRTAPGARCGRPAPDVALVVGDPGAPAGHTGGADVIEGGRVGVDARDDGPGGRTRLEPAEQERRSREALAGCLDAVADLHPEEAVGRARRVRGDEPGVTGRAERAVHAGLVAGAHLIGAGAGGGCGAERCERDGGENDRAAERAAKLDRRHL